MLSLVNMETERLVIRHWRPGEAPRVLDLLSRIEVVRWLGDGEPELLADLSAAEAKIASWRARDDGLLGAWAVQPRSSGVPAGTVLLLRLPHGEPDEVEIGWHLHPDSWGHGYATEAARAVLDHAFAGGLPHVHALTHLDNHASQGVCRRLGMRDLGVVEKWYDGPSQLYRVTAAEWASYAARRGASRPEGQSTETSTPTRIAPSTW